MKENKKLGINWIGLFYIIMSAVIMGLLGIGLPYTVTEINELTTLTYSLWASHFGLCLLFYLMTYKTKIIEEVNKK